MLVLTKVRPHVEIVEVTDFDTCMNSITDTYGTHIPTAFIYEILTNYSNFIVPDYTPHDFELFPYTSIAYVLIEDNKILLQKQLKKFLDTYYILHKFTLGRDSIIVELYEIEDTYLADEINAQLRKFTIANIIKDLC